MKEIAEGAEAKIFFDKGRNTVVKHRVKKSYRLAEIDERLRKFRTRREAKVFEALQDKILIPALLHYSDETMKIEMGFVNGKKLRDILSRKNAKKFCYEVGEKIGLMHASNVIHGDLTTSNMILSGDKKIYFIDFGLSFFSNKAEDKAVDLHLLRQTLESKHHTIWRECFDAAVRGYKKTCPAAGDVLKRFEKVESRGRYKGKKA
jgi:Kae1-associated kinase Bud32